MLKPPLPLAVALAAFHLANFAVAQQGATDPIADLVSRYDEAIAKQDADEAKAEAPAKATYIRDLEKIRDDCKARAQLDALIEAEAVLKAVREGTEPPSGKLLKAPLAQARSTYDRAREASLRPYAPVRARLQADYDRSILELEQKLTRAGNLDAARKARDARRVILKVESHVDGPSTLYVKKDGLYWVNGRNAKPDATYVNGRKWEPRWGKPDQERGADKTDIFPLALPTMDLKVELTALSRHQGESGIESRTPIDVKLHGGEIQITVPDPESGPRWYTLVFKQK